MNDRDEKLEKLIDRLDERNDELDEPSTSDSPDPGMFVFELQLQAKIDAALRRRHSFQTMDAKKLKKQLQAKVEKAQTSTKLRESGPRWNESKKWSAVVAIAASIVFFAAIWSWNDQDENRVSFQRIPLAQIFHETVQRGFKPYYVCDDPIRFANEFKRRQGVALRLTEMPNDHQMVGISYLGGISRDSTIMLGKAYEKPVLVFVDRLQNDDTALRDQIKEQDGLTISRLVLDELVFYEVSEFEAPQLLQYFEIIE